MEFLYFYCMKLTSIGAVGYYFINISCVGNAGLQSTDVANAFASTFTKFSATNPKNLRTIEVVIFQPHMLADFQSSINSSSPNPSFAASGYKPKPKPRKFTFNSQHKQQHYLVLYFTSNNRNSIEQVRN